MGAQNNKKEAEIEAIRKDANEHQDRMTEIIKTQANAAYGAQEKSLHQQQSRLEVIIQAAKI